MPTISEVLRNRGEPSGAPADLVGEVTPRTQMAGEQTTHDDIVRAMQKGQIKPELLFGTAAAAGGASALANALRRDQP